MPFSRILVSMLKNRSTVLRRYGQGRDAVGQPIFRKFHSSSYRAAKMPSSRPLVTDGISSTSYSWRYFLLPTSILGGIGGAAIFLHFNDERSYFERNVKGTVIGGPFSLIDTTGRVVTEQDIRGNWILLYFGYTSSPDFGPAEVQKLAKAINVLGSKQDVKVLPIFVTIDPQRDTPSQLRAYLKEFDSRIVALTGSVNAVRQMAQEYRIFFKKVEEDGGDYLVESSHNTYLLNRNMEIVRCFGVEYGPEELSEAVVQEIKKMGV